MHARSTTRFGALALSAAVSLFALAACSGGGSAEDEDKAEAPAAQTPGGNAAAPAAAAAAGGGAPAATDVATVGGQKFADFKGDAAAGQTVFIQCKTCHELTEGVNKIGPSLHKVVGRAAGTVATYTYSPANKNSGITWSQEKLFQYLENPQRVVPGTKMAFAGIPDPQKRADLIAYLAAQ
jgi:cytochrome c